MRITDMNNAYLAIVELLLLIQCLKKRIKMSCVLNDIISFNFKPICVVGKVDSLCIAVLAEKRGDNHHGHER